MSALKACELAPRSQRHVYDTMVTMFNRAVPRLITTNPCSIEPDDLPKRQDADPEWRATAIFERDEVLTILTSDEIPIDRRTIYSVMFLAGMRIGEVSALHVRHYNPNLKPLGSLHVALSYNSRLRRLKSTKTERPRLVPVHPWLARILDRWLNVEWERMMGRPPQPDDILFPTRNWTHRNHHNAYNQMNGVRPKPRARSQSSGPQKMRPRRIGDLERVGLRPRRQHDTRRTFITLAQADGARKDLLRLITHGPEGDVMDMYTSMPWAPLCEEVAKLKLSPPAPAPLSALPNTANSWQSGLPQGCHPGNPEQNEEVVMVTPPGIEPARSARKNEENGGHGRKAAPGLGFDRDRSPPKPAEGPAARSMATVATLALRQALNALEQGRVDLAKAILQQAIESEASASRAGDAS
jgi:integrase